MDDDAILARDLTPAMASPASEVAVGWCGRGTIRGSRHEAPTSASEPGRSHLLIPARSADSPCRADRRNGCPAVSCAPLSDGRLVGVHGSRSSASLVDKWCMSSCRSYHAGGAGPPDAARGRLWCSGMLDLVVVDGRSVTSLPRPSSISRGPSRTSRPSPWPIAGRARGRSGDAGRGHLEQARSWRGVPTGPACHRSRRRRSLGERGGARTVASSSS